jgi:predicted nuclease of restriction endonuclease-like (RecB) superfamily
VNKDSVLHDQFIEITQRITAARQNAFQSANTVLLDLYWQIGEYISHKIAIAEWTKSTVEQLAQLLAQSQPGLRGFTSINLLRMQQFYEIYKDHKKVAVLVKLLPWAHNLIILNHSKSFEEREFYLRIALQEGWSCRELEHQFKSNLFERVVLLPRKIVPMMLYSHPGIAAPLSDAYILEFLGIPHQPTETKLQRILIHKLKSFFIEWGRDFCFLDSDFPLQISEWDFSLDLLFFHRGLNALMAIELKLAEFTPTHLEQLSFYLETLDNNVKKTHEQPGIGLLLCVNKEHNTIEYVFNKTHPPTYIAQCKSYLPSKAILQAKLNEFYIEEDNEVMA